LMVSDSAATQLSMMISESTELCARTNTGFIWRQSRWWFHSRQRLSFRLRFWTQ
jgi:hypothetical protein